MNLTRLRASTRAALLSVLASLAGCATIGDRGQPLVPSGFQSRTGPFVVFTNTPLSADDNAVKQLAALRVEVEETLGLRVEAGEQPIEVYILGDRKSYEHFVAFYYPDLPQRRAFFIAQGPRRVVYTFKGDRLTEDLRHEATHALLNLAVGDIPLWLDEGLAEYFEGVDEHGVNRDHLARLPIDFKEGWSADLERLERLKTVREMTPRDYRESWVWVHYLLNGPNDGRSALLGYLADLREPREAKPLSTRLTVPWRDSSKRLAAYVDGVRAPEPPRALAAEPTVRLQDGAIEIEPLPGASKKRGFFARLFGRLAP